LFCNYCGAQNPNDAVFCSACGRTTSNKQASEEKQGQSHQQTHPSVLPNTTNESKESEIQGFANIYARMADDELLALSKDMNSLREAAREALVAEVGRRNLTITQTIASESRYKGVGGWLALFILGLTVFSPILTAINLITEFEQFGLVLTTVTDAVISVVVMCFGIYAGVSLLQIKPNAVRIAKRYLIAYFIYSAVLFLLVVLGNAFAQANEKNSSQGIGSIGRAFGYVIVWYSYLEQSKRIAATYPPEKLSTS
jgi:uncharacterized Zn finger protein (UPF0148 family)